MTTKTKTDLAMIIVLSDIAAVVDPTDTPDDLYPEIAAWITSLSGSGEMSIVTFNPNTFTRRRNVKTNGTDFFVQKPEVTVSPNWEYKPAGSTAHIDASIRSVL